MTIQAVIFDVGGVISRVTDHSKIRAWEARLGLPEKGLAKELFGTEQAGLAMIGKVGEPEHWQHVGARLGLEAKQVKELQNDFWAGWQLDVELVQFIRALRPRYKTALLSNAFSGARQAFDKFGFGDAIDTIVISAEEGVAKPDPRIYQITLDRLGVQPGQSIFVDDTTENTLAAQALGMHGIQFRNTQQTMTDITRYLYEYTDH